MNSNNDHTMSSFHQPVPFEYIDDQLPFLASHESFEVGDDFSFLDLETADVAAFSEPLGYSSMGTQPMPCFETAQQSQYPAPELWPETDIVAQLSDLSLLNDRLQQRVDELNATCGELQKSHVPSFFVGRQILANES